MRGRGAFLPALGQASERGHGPECGVVRTQMEAAKRRMEIYGRAIGEARQKGFYDTALEFYRTWEDAKRTYDDSARDYRRVCVPGGSIRPAPPFMGPPVTTPRVSRPGLPWGPFSGEGLLPESGFALGDHGGGNMASPAFFPGFPLFSRPVYYAGPPGLRPPPP